MKEELPVEQSKNLEEFILGIVTVSKENIHELENIRRVVDGEKNIVPEKFGSELQCYESGGDHSAFLMRDAGKVVGYIEVDLAEDYIPKGADKELCRELQNHGHIARIGLLPEYRGQKIGNKLLDHAEIWVRDRGATAVWLDYLPENEALVHFYKAAGYKTFTEFQDGDKNRLRCIALKYF